MAESPPSSSLPSPGQAALSGAARFVLPSLLVFATVAYGERWMYQTVGFWGSYAVWALLFILLSGLALRPLVADPGRRRAFPWIFAGAFCLYAIGWMAGYFLLRRPYGELPAEIAASAGGSALLAAALAGALGASHRLAPMFLLLVIGNTAGYFTGGALYAALGRPLGMLLWGVAYGLFLGAALGLALRKAQS